MSMAPTLELLEQKNTQGLREKSKTIQQIEAYNENPEQWHEIIKTGGDLKDSFDWNEAWYPVYIQEDLDKSKPMKIKILNQSIVIWWDSNASHHEAVD